MTGQAGTVYLLHFDRPYQHARHYLGNTDSSRFLKGCGAVLGREFAELAGSSGVAGRKASRREWRAVNARSRAGRAWGCRALAGGT